MYPHSLTHDNMNNNGQNKDVYRYLLYFLLILTAQLAVAEDRNRRCPASLMELERLPDMQTPRAGHAVFCVNGELTVIGGHTTGFVPTTTAEYFANGAWHSVNMVYTHDSGLFEILKSGQVLLLGGHERNLGIGQSFEVEMYNPADHTFKGFGCLDRKRCLGTAVEMADGTVVISGNWYAEDGIEEFDGTTKFKHIKSVTQKRSCPYILRSSPNDVLIFSGQDTHGKPIDSIVADRLRGNPLPIPILKHWKPIPRDTPYRMANAFIGDERQNLYAYLLPVRNDSSQLGIIKVEGIDFSLLPTTCPIPIKCQWGHIQYTSHLLADRKAKCAYVTGWGENIEKGQQKGYRLYVLRIDYARRNKGNAPIHLYYSKPMKEIPCGLPTITDEGDLILTGGITMGSNFEPSAAVYLIRTGTRVANGSGNGNGWIKPWQSWWGWVAAGLALTLAFLWLKRNRRATSLYKTFMLTAVVSGDRNSATHDEDAELMERICTLMEQQKPYLRNDLKLQDIAGMLEVSRAMVSKCINARCQCSFTQFVAAYRVNYAKELIRKSPEKKMLHVWTEAGFANETSFFRTFKTFTGMTPNEFKAK